jgi:hypothetical protein
MANIHVGVKVMGDVHLLFFLFWLANSWMIEIGIKRFPRVEDTLLISVKEVRS